MRKFIFLGFILLNFIANAQNVSVEKNLNSVQLGLLSFSYQNETRLDRKISLRSEIGLASGSSLKEQNGQKETSFLILPFINVEPRWYYGLDRRARLNRETKNNTSNYISLLTSFVSSRTALVNTKDFEVAPYITVIPEYGTRRSIGKQFFWEGSAGVGYQHNFLDKSYTYKIHENALFFDVQYKIGYIF